MLSSILNGRAVTYASGLAAFHAMLVFLNPRRIAIGPGYHGSHAVISLLAKKYGLQTLDLDCAAEELCAGDVVHVETPWNPAGEARDLARYAAKTRSVGAYLTVDATFAPPPLQDPFVQGADVVMHSGTKYFGGHSDMLCGILAVREERGEWAAGLAGERTVLGSVMGSFEGWLGLRSVRTLEIRVERQSLSAELLVGWLAGEVQGEGVVGGVVERVQHASLQREDLEGGEGSWLRRQMPRGFGPVFALWMKSERLARRLPSKLRLFHHATSVGGVESLVEWRSMSDKMVDKRLLRVSVGIEAWEDLRNDLMQAFEALAVEGA